MWSNISLVDEVGCQQHARSSLRAQSQYLNVDVSLQLVFHAQVTPRRRDATVCRVRLGGVNRALTRLYTGWPAEQNCRYRVLSLRRPTQCYMRTIATDVVT